MTIQEEKQCQVHLKSPDMRFSFKEDKSHKELSSSSPGHPFLGTRPSSGWHQGPILPLSA